MTNVVIIDDKQANIQTLCDLVKEYCPTVKVTATANNINEGQLIIRKHIPDIVFLDIEMYEGTGFDLLDKFKNPFFETIFTTAYDQYAVRAFREQAIDYLLKPIDITSLQEAVLKAERHIQLKKAFKNESISQDVKVSLPTQDGYLFVDEKNIIRCEGLRSYTYFYFIGGNKILVSMHLKECENILPPNSFLRVHNSHIINITHVSKYIRGRGGYLIMSDNSVVDVSPMRKELFFERIKKLGR